MPPKKIKTSKNAEVEMQKKLNQLKKKFDNLLKKVNLATKTQGK